MTRIPELEQELVAAAARLQSPRRLVRPAARAALAVGAVLAVALLAIVLAAGSDSDRRSQPAGALPAPPSADQESTFEAPLSPEEKIERTALRWARLFAASDRAACKYMTQPACERDVCVRVPGVPVPGCKLPSPAFRLSFRDATVEQIEIKGERAAARFSNGEAIELDRVNGYAVGGVWWVHKFGGDAGRKFF